MITAAPRVTVASDDPKDGADASKHDIPIEVPSGTAARLRATRRREHAALAVLLAGTALLYMWGLDRSGWANTFYSAAVQAGTKSWKAFFFGSSDASNFITVDKPPLALWPMEIAARVFGLSSWTVLVPQAIEGVASVALLYAAVRRWFGAHAGLLGGAVLALTPVAALMFRFNNPDALLVLFLTAAAYCSVRALEGGKTRWLLGVGALVGTGFLTKYLQAYLVVPAIAGVYLLAAPVSLRRRLWQLAGAAGVLVVSSAWWLAIVELVPSRDRPYIGGSQDNNVFNLIFGYNGLGRITGNETGSVTGGATSAASVWGPTGWDRLFLPSMGGQISWLIPAALVLFVGALVAIGRAPRTHRMRAALILWAGWLLVTGAVFSFAKGIIHPYYTVALAPAVGALVAMGVAVLWPLRAALWVRLVLAGALLATAVWSFVLLDRSPDWYPGLRFGVLAAGILASIAIVAAAKSGRAIRTTLAAMALASALGGPIAYSLDTAATAYAGALPSAGPTVAGSFGPGGGGPARAGSGGVPGSAGSRGLATGGVGGRGALPGGAIGTRPPPPGLGGRPPGASSSAGSPTGGLPGATGLPSGLPASGTGPGSGTSGLPGRTGGIGSLLVGSTPGAAVVKMLEQDASGYTWVASAVGSNTAAGYQLATEDPVMAIGGFNGTDPAPTLAEFQQFVKAHRIHYFISGGVVGGAGGNGSSDASSITTWVADHFSSKTVDGVTLYDLTAAQ
jgi:4-amino-4-deoxy-L-arabinose transferase-like glycosyltransferase